MLLQFSVENFRSFCTKQEFDMIATSERNGRKHLPRIQSRYRMSVNPVAAIYGANASGKSNLVRALAQMKDVVLSPRSVRKPLPFDPFRLDPESPKTVTGMSISIIQNEIMFSYELKWDRKQIHFEQLTQYGSRNETVLFRRTRNIEELEVAKQYHGSDIETVLQGIAPNLTVLSAVANWNNPKDSVGDTIRGVYHWFERLFVIAADEWDDRLIGTIGFFSEVFGLDENIRRIDAGVEGFNVSQISTAEIGMDEEDLNEILSDLEEGKTRSFNHRGSLYSVSRKDDEVVVKKLTVNHRTKGDLVPLPWSDESDGTKQTIRMLPLLMLLRSSKHSPVIIIDELDRSLHTQLARQLVSSVISSSSPESRGQLLFTTHDVMLLDTTLLRRDQLWVVEKDKGGDSRLIPLTNYEGLRIDKDIRKSYLDGRFGGVPRTIPFDLGSATSPEE